MGPRDKCSKHFTVVTYNRNQKNYGALVSSCNVYKISRGLSYGRKMVISLAFGVSLQNIFFATDGGAK
jgi:hypothetical protein